MKKTFVMLLGWLIGLSVCAQIMEPARFSSELKSGQEKEGEIVFQGTIDRGWHVYSTDMKGAGPIEASFHATKMEGVELVGPLKAKGNELNQYDPNFGTTLRFFEGSVTFVQKVRFTQPTYQLDGYLEYGICGPPGCLPPQEVSIKKNGNSPGTWTDKSAAEEAKKEEKTSPEETREPEGDVAEQTMLSSDSLVLPLSATDSVAAGWWKPVVKEMQALGGVTTSTQDRSWLYIFLMGFIGGLLALLTPCVWPIIPMTVSFFLKRAENRKQAIRDAITYGISIVVIYLTLGLLVTALFGPSFLNALSTNAVFNVFLFLLLVVFALSFFGWFEIRLPSSWGNSIDSKASSTSGLVSIFLMAFTLALVSFSCTAPIVGLLLVESVTSGNWIGPAIGMLGFALALALPFTLFALFPSWLKQAPKSGAWMNTVKVVLGFIELAFSLKFLSVADLAYGWHLLDREVFLSLWIVIFGLLGLYLIGKLHFQSDYANGEPKPMPVICIMGGLCSLAFAVYMLPGLWGAPCKAVSAFAPPMSTQDFNLNNNHVEARYTNYEEGMAAALREGKPAMLDFTGFGCVNCRKMEAAVWNEPSVAKMLNNDYVLISLYVDDKTPLAEPMEVEEQGTIRMLRTVGDRWSYLQRMKFGANVQPFYVVVDGAGNPLSGSYSYDEDVRKFVGFLQESLK